MAQNRGRWSSLVLTGAFCFALGTMVDTTDVSDQYDSNRYDANAHTEQLPEKFISPFTEDYRIDKIDDGLPSYLYVDAVYKKANEKWENDIEECLKSLDDNSKSLEYARSVKKELDNLKERAKINRSDDIKNKDLLNNELIDDADYFYFKYLLAIALCL